jgi:hypothetical protein
MREFKELYKVKRLQYCRWFTHFIQGGTDILVFYSDEAWFHLSGYVNSHNSRIRSAENPHTFHERPLHSLKVSVRCAVFRRRIIVPIFFSEKITAERYQELIMNFISIFEVDEQDCWFQQDWFTAHTANLTMQCWASSLVVALFPETCGPIDPRIYRHRISNFGFFLSTTCTKTTRTHYKIEAKYWGVHFKLHCGNSSPVCIKHEEKSECMHRCTRWTFPILHFQFFLFSRSQGSSVSIVSDYGLKERSSIPDRGRGFFF